MRHFHLKNLCALLALLIFFACNSSTGSNNGATVPGTPITITGVPGNAQVTVYWNPPSGGAAIASYTATAVEDTSKQCTISTVFYCVVKDLTNGVAYTFTVRATNAAGKSPPSAPSVPVAPAAALKSIPDPPTNATARAGYTQAKISWSIPSSNGGSAITGYTVTAVQDPSKHCSSETDTSCVVTGLTNGTAYTFTVTATNAVGTSIPSSPSASVTPAIKVPDAPTNVTATGGVGLATVYWSTPNYDGGSPITGYTVTTVQDGSKQCTSTSDSSCVVTGLTNGTSYTFTVTATSTLGISAASSPTVAVIPSAIPGVNWTPQYSGATNNLNSVTWTGTQLVAVGYDGLVLTSPDGVTWTKKNSGTTSPLFSVTWMGTQLVAVGGNWTGASDGLILTSPDGATWTKRSTGVGFVDGLNSVTWTGNLLVAVGGRGLILTSPDGVAWTKRNNTVNTPNPLISVIWTGTQLVAVGNSGDILFSQNGINWTSSYSGTTNYFSSIAWTGSQLVAVGQDILTSSDGVAWTTRSTGTSLASVIWTGTQLVAVGYNSGTDGTPIGVIATSPDGVTWTTRIVKSDWTILEDVAWTGSKLVAVGWFGQIWTSP